MEDPTSSPSRPHFSKASHFRTSSHYDKASHFDKSSNLDKAVHFDMASFSQYSQSSQDMDALRSQSSIASILRNLEQPSSDGEETSSASGDDTLSRHHLQLAQALKGHHLQSAQSLKGHQLCTLGTPLDHQRCSAFRGTRGGTSLGMPLEHQGSITKKAPQAQLTTTRNVASTSPPMDIVRQVEACGGATSMAFVSQVKAAHQRHNSMTVYGPSDGGTPPMDIVSKGKAGGHEKCASLATPASSPSNPPFLSSSPLKPNPPVTSPSPLSSNPPFVTIHEDSELKAAAQASTARPETTNLASSVPHRPTDGVPGSYSRSSSIANSTANGSAERTNSGVPGSYLKSSSTANSSAERTNSAHEDLELRILTERLRILRSQREVASLRCQQFVLQLEASMWQRMGVPATPSSQTGVVPSPGSGVVPSSGWHSNSADDDEQYWSSPNFYRGKQRGNLPPPAAFKGYALGSRMPLDSYFLDNQRRRQKSIKPPNRHIIKSGGRKKREGAQ